MLTISEILRSEPAAKVIFDCARVTAIDVKAQTSMTAVWDTITTLRGLVRLVASEEMALDFLRTTPVSIYLQVFGSVQEASNTGPDAPPSSPVPDLLEPLTAP